MIQEVIQTVIQKANSILGQDVSEAWKQLKSYMFWFLIIPLICIFLIHSCHTPIIPAKPEVIATESILRSNTGVVVKIPTPVIGKKPVINVRVQEGKVIQTTVFKNDFGWENKFGVWGGLGFDGFNGGLSYSGPYYWRIYTQGLLGVKSSGLGISYRIFTNTNVGVSYNLNYSLLSEPTIFVGLNF